MLRSALVDMSAVKNVQRMSAFPQMIMRHMSKRIWKQIWLAQTQKIRIELRRVINHNNMFPVCNCA